MMDFCSRFYRITTDKTDLSGKNGKGYKFAKNAEQLSKIMRQFTVVCVECKAEDINGHVSYKSMSDVDLTCVLDSVKG